MNEVNNSFIPDWIEEPPEKYSYRSIFKWGDPKGFKHPNKPLYDLMKEKLGLTDDDFRRREHEGHEKVVCDTPVGLDIVVHPRDKKDVQKIVSYCHNEKIPIYAYGGGSSVNFGHMPVKGGISLVLKTHMNKIVEFNETDQTVRVQPGMMGPAYEEALNKAPENFSAKRGYTGGHFPQSFEYSSVGGWVLTLGSGQQSSYYGDAYDLVLSQEFVTPVGEIKTLDYAATATGPKINDIMKGSEGSFGILTELTMKVFCHMPENQKDFAFIFPRHTEGEKGFSLHVKKMVKQACKKHGAMYLTGYPMRNWRKGRYSDPYMREDLQDYGIITDTVESSVGWSNLHKLHQGVRSFVKSRPHTMCLTHASHFYPQGTNLYFIFIAKYKDIDEYKKFLDGIMGAIQQYGGSISHHHGVGKMFGPFMEKHLGKNQMDVLRALKQHFDPNNIMNPGGQLGLDESILHIKSGELTS